jgi:hypothetical protein
VKLLVVRLKMSSMDDLINILADLGGVIATRVSKLLAVLSQNKVRKSKLLAYEVTLALIVNEHRQFLILKQAFLPLLFLGIAVPHIGWP